MGKGMIKQRINAYRSPAPYPDSEPVALTVLVARVQGQYWPGAGRCLPDKSDSYTRKS